MISHALTIVINELNEHLTAYGASGASAQLGNLAEGFKSGAANAPGVARDILNFSLVNIKEEKALKNLPSYVRNDAKLTAVYQNPPIFLNFQILLVATHVNYSDALLMLSRALRFFQQGNVFTQDSVAPSSITKNQPINPLDRLSEFKLIFDLCSPSMEEVNHLWGTLGGKQYPFALYLLRMLDLKFASVQSESGLITEVVTGFHHKNVGIN